MQGERQYLKLKRDYKSYYSGDASNIPGRPFWFYFNERHATPSNQCQGGKLGRGSANLRKEDSIRSLLMKGERRHKRSFDVRNLIKEGVAHL